MYRKWKLPQEQIKDFNVDLARIILAVLPEVYTINRKWRESFLARNNRPSMIPVRIVLDNESDPLSLSFRRNIEVGMIRWPTKAHAYMYFQLCRGQDPIKAMELLEGIPVCELSKVWEHHGGSPTPIATQEQRVEDMEIVLWQAALSDPYFMEALLQPGIVNFHYLRTRSQSNLIAEPVWNTISRTWVKSVNWADKDPSRSVYGKLLKHLRGALIQLAAALLQNIIDHPMEPYKHLRAWGYSARISMNTPEGVKWLYHVIEGMYCYECMNI